MSENNKNIEVDKLIIKLLNGEATTDEKMIVDDWRNSSGSNEKLFIDYEKIWETAGKEHIKKQIDVEAAWKKFEDAIDVNEMVKKPKPKTISILSNKFARIAAIIILLIISGAAFYIFNWHTNKEITIVTANMETNSFELSDGTKVTLNANSVFRYPKKYKKNVRQVYLTGEAFFEVAKDKNKPFIIETTETLIKVLGTSFNVNTYEDDGTVELVVNTGMVSLSDKDGMQEVVLEAGEKGIYSGKEKSIIKNNNPDPNYLSWKTKTLVFENQPLSYIVETINNVYHSNIEIIDPGISDCRMTASFDNQTLEEVIEVIIEALDLNKEIRNQTILISGDGC